MPLESGKSEESFKHNVEAEIKVIITAENIKKEKEEE